MSFERIYLSSVEQSNTINAADDKHTKQSDVAACYADAIIADHLARKQGITEVDFELVNQAIRARWPKGLNRVREQAWKILKKSGIAES